MIVALLLAGVAGGWRSADAGEAGRKAGATVEEGARTGGRAVRDGARTFGRTTKAFFTRGPRAARETWNSNARGTAETARAGGPRHPRRGRRRRGVGLDRVFARD